MNVVDVNDMYNSKKKLKKQVSLKNKNIQYRMSCIDQIVNYIIRPTRDQYHINRLGHRYFCLQHNHQTLSVRREDKQLLNGLNQRIEMSFFHNSIADPEVCVVYLHANNGSRVEGLQYLGGLLMAGYNVCLFDFSGSGLSQGEYISLGFNEATDLQFVMRDLIYQMRMKKVILWGRSMGACTALIYANKYPSNVHALILDSPYKDLKKLIKQLGSQRTYLPKCFFQPIMCFIDAGLRDKIGRSLSDYKLKNYMGNLKNIPALFLVSKIDKLVKPHHGQKLFIRYPNKDKWIEYIDIEHHENRTNEIIHKCVKFISLTLNQRQAIKTTIVHKMNEMKGTRSRNLIQSSHNSSGYLMSEGEQTHRILYSGSTKTSLQDGAYHNFNIRQRGENKISLREPIRECRSALIETRNYQLQKKAIDVKQKISLATFVKQA